MYGEEIRSINFSIFLLQHSTSCYPRANHFRLSLCKRRNVLTSTQYMHTYLVQSLPSLDRSINLCHTHIFLLHTHVEIAQ